MKGDFTRSTFKPEKHYRGVRMQQGRVQLDADWNEQLDIDAHRTETEATDVIGGCGAPMHNAGFSLTNGAIPKVGPGRYYVDGILCENDAAVDLDKQPDLPVAALGDLITPKNAATPDGLYLAYLDVWQRHITALEDEGIREVALGGPDTATRTKTIWQVKLLGPLPAPLTCASEPAAWKNLLDTTQNGLLSARAAAAEDAEGPCVTPPSAGYRRLENQLYRAEVHAVDVSGKITLLKWSRDNGAIVTRWLKQTPSKPSELIVSSIGRDDVLRFGPGQYVEVIDDQRELRGEAGILVKLANAEGEVLTLDVTDPNAASVDKANFPDTLAGLPNNPKARRWDGVLANPAGGAWLELEDGVQVQVEAGKRYHVGDYWLIPARTATADVEWPRDTATPPNPIPQPRAGIEHHFCKLAIVSRAAGVFTVVQDCRKLFPPLTELITLLYVGGDGQEAMPGNALPQPLRVRVVNGQAPVIGAQVRFTVVQGGGSLSVAQPMPTTGPNGIAECGWTLGAAGLQRVEAVLLDAGGAAVPGQILRFGANLSIASQVAYDPSKCSNLAAAKTVQDAIDILCQARGGGRCICVGKGGDYERLDEALKDLMARGERDICICLLHGEQEVGGIEIERKAGEPELHIKIAGCGPGSRLILRDPIRFSGVNSVLLRDFAVDIAFMVEVDGGALTLDQCARVEVRGCHLAGFVVAGALFAVTHADRVVLAENLFEALSPESFAPTRKIFEAVAQESGVDAPLQLFGLADTGELRRTVFQRVALDAAQKIAGLDLTDRKKVQSAVQRVIATPEQRALQSQGELLSYSKLVLALGGEALNAATTLDLLLDIRRTAAKTRPGTAIILERARRLSEAAGLLPIVNVLDQDDTYLLANNEIVGIVSLYGPPAPIPFIDELLNVDFLQRISSRLKENQIRLINSFLGTLQLRGNQIVRMAVGTEVIEELRKAAEGQQSVTFPIDLFGRCQWGDNVFEAGRSFVVCRHLTLHANEFTQTAQPQAAPGITPAAAPVLVGTIVADSTIYVANHGSGNATLRNLSRLMDQVANQELTIS
jgi:hypothetical protein